MRELWAKDVLKLFSWVHTSVNILNLIHCAHEVDKFYDVNLLVDKYVGNKAL